VRGLTLRQARTGRTRPTLRAIAALLLAAAAAAGCGGNDRAAPPAATAAPTTSAPPAVFPLTGLPTGGDANAARPALSIKVDNTRRARPQAGLNDADLVHEELVEGGLTRLLVTYHSKDAGEVAPVRSVRPVDGPLLRQLGGGLFALSGGAAGVVARVQPASGATFVGPDQAPEAYRRAGDRPAPYNLVTGTAALYEAGRRLDPGLRPPPPFLTFAEEPPAGGRPVRQAELRFSPSSRAAWRWDAAGGRFVREQDGTPARLADGEPVTTDNVVVLGVAIRLDENRDVLGNRTPDPVVVGSGRAWLLRDGRVVAGTWRRASAAQPLRLLGQDGQPLPLRPGRTWVELLPASERPAFG
jgi:Protein of unknown function (DUF3048) N-terminal domain/Protein of unknown function (DUF3048) C-terminal domain